MGGRLVVVLVVVVMLRLLVFVVVNIVMWVVVLVLTRLSCFNVKTICFISNFFISLVRLKLISSLG